MPSYICTTCGTGYAETDTPRETCEPEPGLTGIGSKPEITIDGR